MDEQADRAARAAQRRFWPVRAYDLGKEPSENLCETTTAEQRVEMMWELACRAWLLSGRAMPDYERSAMPGRVFRRRA